MTNYDMKYKSMESFTACLYAKVAKVKKLQYFTKLNNSFHSDLHWWYTFVIGCSFLHLINRIDYHIYTDTLGPWDMEPSSLTNSYSACGQPIGQKSISWQKNLFQLPLAVPFGAQG